MYIFISVPNYPVYIILQIITFCLPLSITYNLYKFTVQEFESKFVTLAHYAPC